MRTTWTCKLIEPSSFCIGLPRGESRMKRLALILDIDDTALSTYQEMVNADFGYNPESYDAWLAKAQAPAIPGTLRLYKEAQTLGVSVLFVTGRSDKLRTATERNLRAQGFNNWDLLVMRPVAQRLADDR